MNIFSLIQNKNENDLLNVCCYLLDESKVKYTKLKVNAFLLDHVDFPSLLSVKDVLSEYGIESAAINKGMYNYSDFDTPFMSSIQLEDWPTAKFTVITEVDENLVTYLDPMQFKLVQLKINDFELIDKDVVLLIDDDTKVDEAGYVANRKDERIRSIISHIPISLFLTLFVFFVIFLISKNTMDSWIGLGFLSVSFVGLLAVGLLIWHEVDMHNPFIKEVCGRSGKKLNCNAVLNSAQSKFLGISWISWGFSYMATLFFIQILFVNQFSYLVISSFLSLAVTPYIIFSLYYQAGVVKQWCPLCLVVQFTLLINAIIGVIFLIFKDSIISELGYSPLINTFFLGLLSLVLIYYAIPILKKAMNSKDYEKKWKQLRYHPDVFQSLLNKSTGVSIPDRELGIVVGNPDAKHELIKVCNPYCGPCSRAHVELKNLLKRVPNIKVRIIFTASGLEKDISTQPVAHLLAIKDKYGQLVLGEALNDWYLSKSKDYNEFALKYPVDRELKVQKEKIVAMRKWCDNMKIRATPTLIINGRELPDSYSIDELKNFF